MQLVLAKLGLESRSKCGALLWILPEENEGKKETASLKKHHIFLKEYKLQSDPDFDFTAAQTILSQDLMSELKCSWLKPSVIPHHLHPFGPANPVPLTAPQRLSFPFIHSVCLHWAFTCTSALPGTSIPAQMSPACSSTCPHPPRLRASSLGTLSQKTHTHGHTRAFTYTLLQPTVETFARILQSFILYFLCF